MRVLLLSICFLTWACSNAVYKKSSLQLGTIINLTMVCDEQTAVNASQLVFKEIERLENLLSPYRAQSDISVINSLASQKKITIAPETAMLIAASQRISQETRGAFDITFASIAHLWNYKRQPFVPPTKKQIEKVRHLVNYRHINLHNCEIALALSGVKIGLGAIAKGYAVKRGVEILKHNGVKSGIVEEGGDLQVFGTKFGTPWKTGLKHPRSNDILLIITLNDMDSIATSGDYERVAYFNGKRYHHIVDPHTGYPTETFSSVSVVSKDPMLSDAYATAIFVMGLQRTRELLSLHADLGVILVDVHGKLYITKNLQKKVALLVNIPIQWM